MDLGVTVTSSTYNTVLAKSDNFSKKAITVKSGEGSLSIGQILAPELSGGKYVALGALTDVSAEASGVTGDGSKTQFLFDCDKRPVLPGSVVVKHYNSSDVLQNTFTDDGHGKLACGSAIQGQINYNTGDILINHWTPASGDYYTIDYTHFGDVGDVNIEHLAILDEAVDATSADVSTTAIHSGTVVAENLTPALTITNENHICLMKKNGILLSDIV